MEKNSVKIQAALKVAKHAENVEVIELALEGDQRVLVRSKNMPEFAFLLWSDHRPSTHSWLGLDLPDTPYENSSYPVVCACCDTEIYGVTKPGNVGDDRNSDVYKEWSSGLGQAFKHVLSETCKKNGITTIFMRRASSWYHGELDNIKIVEAMNYQEAILELYGRQVIRVNTKFISQSTSRGMSGH